MKSKVLTIIASIAIAFGLWFYVITVEHTQVDHTFYDVPVVLDGISVLDTRDLMITSDTDLTVDLRLSGNRTNLNKLKKSDITVLVDLSRTYEAGQKELTYKVEISGSNSIEVVHREPEVIAITVEQVASKEVPVELHVEQGAIPNGFELFGSTTNFTSVAIRGPKNVVDQIQMAKVNITEADIAANRIATSDVVVVEKKITLCDGQGVAVADVSDITVNRGSIRAELQVPKVKDIPFTWQVIPGGGLTEKDVSVAVNIGSITLGGSEAEMDALTHISLGLIDLSNSSIQDGLSFTRLLNLSESLTNISGITEVSVTVTFNKEVAIKTVKIASNQFQSMNKPQNLEPQYQTRELTVTLRGSVAAMAQLDEKNVIVKVNLTNLRAGERANYTAIVTVEGTTEIGAIGSYFVNASAVPV